MAKKTAKAITRLQKFLAAIAGDTTPPEPVTNDERLLYNIAEKANEPADDKFIVTLTPTAEDFSGTMDHTVAEIDEAYKAGRQVVFRTMMSETNHMDADCTARWNTENTYPSFNGFILSTENSGALIFAWTGTTNDGTKATYGANIYTLTPAT